MTNEEWCAAHGLSGRATYRETPTCETGFWEPSHKGCPVCGPDGPCRDPEYEALIEEVQDGKQFRRLLLVVSAIVLLAALVATTS